LTIIDCHAHIYPDNIALKAAASIGKFYDISMHLDGTLQTLLKKGDEAGISRFLVHSVAVTWERAQQINDYLMQTVRAHPDRLIGFGTLHPDHPDTRSELKRIKAGGLQGIKLHPDFQRFHLDDPKAIALFEPLADLSMPLLTPTGDTRFPYSEPARMSRALKAVPNLKVICAHFGGWSIWEEGWKELAGHPNVWVDCSSSLYALRPMQAADIIRRYGAGRVFFGSDYPMWDPAEELKRFMTVPLTDEERDLILHRNLEAFLGSFCGAGQGRVSGCGER